MTRIPEARTPSGRVLDDLLSRLCGAMQAQAAQVLLVEGSGLRVLASYGVDPVLGPHELPVGSGFVGRIAASGEAAVASDPAQVTSMGAAWAAAGVTSLVGAPLVADARTIGVAVAGSSERPFADSDVAVMAAAAERATWAVRHGMLEVAEQSARRDAAINAERLERLRIIAQELVIDLTVESVVSAVVQRGLSLIGAFGGAVWAYDAADETLRLRGVVGYPDEVRQRWQEMLLSDEGPAPEAASTRRRVVLRSVAERDLRYPSLAGRASVGDVFVAAPLIVGHDVIGVLGMGFETADGLDDEGLAFMDAATAQCATAMHRALVIEAQQRSLAEAQRSAGRLAALQRLTAGLADVRDAAGTLDFIVAQLTEIIGAQQVALCVLDPEADVVRTVRAHGLDPRVEVEFATFPNVAGLPATDALIKREPVLLRSRAERDARYPHLADHPTSERAWACLPLVIGDRGIGALAVSLPHPEYFAPDDVDFLTALADQCAHALDRVRLVEQEAANHARLELLAEAGRIFTAPLDVQLTSVQFSRLVVGKVGDAVSVHLREPDGSYSLAAAEHVIPDQAESQYEIASALSPAIVATYDQILDDGTSVLFSDIVAEDVLALIEDEQLRAALARHPPRSNILLPLVVGGRGLGVLSVTTVDDGRAPLTETDRERMEELAGRLALAIDSARLLRQQTEIAHTLQRSLLPASLPQVPGAEVAVRYLPGAEGVDVGGDFYDVIPLPSGRIGLVVGDVMGRGVRAAAVMGQLRAAVRSYSLEGHQPAALLTRLDRLVGTLEEGLLVTALYAEWDPGRGIVVLSSAGHLPPLLRLPGQPGGYVDIDPGVPLGVGVQSYVEIELALPPGSLLLAYTDGLVENPELPVERGMDQLAAAVADETTAVGVCEAALAALRSPGERAYDDDTALLALVTHPDRRPTDASSRSQHVRTLDLPADTSSPAHARTFVADVLWEWGLLEHLDVGTLLVSELITNGVRHAGTGLRLQVTLLDDRRIRVAVTDHAPGLEVELRPAADDAEGGRGLFLVEHLSQGWGSAADGTGKTVWFELQQ